MWTLFCEDFLARFGSSSAFLYEPLEKFLEYAHIHMDPTHKSINGFLIRFQERREAAGQPDNATTAAFLVESLSEVIRSKAYDILASKSDAHFLTSCERAETVAHQAYQLAYKAGVNYQNDTIAPLFTSKFFRDADLQAVLVPVTDSQDVSAVKSWQDFSCNHSGQSPHCPGKSSGNIHNRVS
ncbi:hypothetical protein DFQ28_003558, partial [Apophysomyces sp. BC1034]